MKKINYYDILSKSQNEKMSIVYTQFLEYGKKRALYCHESHDMGLEYAAAYIAENLFIKWLELRDKKISAFGCYYMNVEYESFIHVFGIVKKSLMTLNTVKGGVYTSEHFATNETEYLPSKLLSKVDSKLLNRPQVRNAKMIDIIDLCTQWENRHVAGERKFNKLMSILNGVDVLKNDDNFSVTMLDYFNTMENADYNTPESKLTDNVYNTMIDDSNTLAMYIDDIKQEKNFAKVLDVLRHGEKTSADKMTIKRFKDRHGFTCVSFDDLKALFM